ncbi:MAG: hypothetical protein V1676_02515 [Candidatus Diapherotrites archaeon]
MDIQDKVVRFYVQNYVMPRALIFNKPGFVDFKISGKTNIFARQLLVPESFFANLEKELVDSFGEKGKKVMYSLGKRFGYRFAQLGRFENISDHPGDAVKQWVTIASKFVEGTYASEISQDADIKTKTVNYFLRNFAVCRVLGYDYFLATGGAAGVIAWILQEPKIEGRLYDSKFEGTEHTCRVKCAVPEILSRDFSSEVFTETNLGDLKPDFNNYMKFNEEVKIRYTKSFQSFLDSNVFKYSRGIITYGSERFFLMEVSATYLLELSMPDKKMKEKIFQTAFSTGKNLFPSLGANDLQSLVEMLSALGWGEVVALPGPKKQVIINHFPWTKFYKDIDYLMIGGLLSGIVSHVFGKNIRFGKPSIDLSHGHLALIFSES